MKTTLTVLVVTLAAALVWALGRGPGRQASLAPQSPAERTEAGEASPGFDFVAQDIEGRAAAPTKRTEISDGVLGNSAAQASDSTLDPATAGSLEILVVAKETGAPLPGVYLRVSSAEDRDGIGVEWGVDEEGAPASSTDEMGLARCLVFPDVAFRIEATVWEENTKVERELEPIAPGESRTVRMELPTRPDAQFFGRVVRAASGEPIPDALVRLLSTTDSYLADDVGSPSTRTALDVRSGPEGWFEIPMSTWSRRNGRVDAEGFGPVVFQFDRGHESRERAFVLELERGAVLRGLILGAPDLGDLFVRAEADGRELAQGAGAMLTWFGDFRRQSPVAQDGTWVMTDLPPEVGLKLELWRGEKRVRSDPERLHLRPGEERGLEWRLGSGTTLLGRAVLAKTNEPMPAVSIWLVPAEEVQGVLFNQPETVTRAITDDAGRFAFEDIPPGMWSVGPAPTNSLGDLPEIDAVAPVATEVEILEGAHTVEVELRLYRGLFISGEVLGLDGDRAEAARVTGVCADTGVWAMSQARDGLYSLGPLPPGSYVLTASRPGSGMPESNPVTAVDGDVDVVLQLQAIGSIQGKLVDASSGEPIMGQVWVTPRAGTRKTGYSRARSEPNGRFRFDRLSIGSYDVAGTTGDLVGRVPEVVIDPSRPMPDVEVLLERGATLLVTYTGEGETPLYHVRSGGSQLYLEGLTSGQTSRVLLPAGRVAVIVEFTDSDGEKREVLHTVDLVVDEETRVEVGDE